MSSQMESVKRGVPFRGTSNNTVPTSNSRKDREKTSSAQTTNRTDFYYLSEDEIASFRTQTCEAVKSGQKCQSEDRCLHSHCMAWQRRNPFITPYSNEQCPNISFEKKGQKMTLVNNCSNKRRCYFAHTKEEQLYHPLSYKTRECMSYPNCHRALCPFAHGEEEIRSKEVIEICAAKCAPPLRGTKNELSNPAKAVPSPPKKMSVSAGEELKQSLMFPTSSVSSGQQLVLPHPHLNSSLNVTNSFAETVPTYDASPSKFPSSPPCEVDDSSNSVNTPTPSSTPHLRTERKTLDSAGSNRELEISEEKLRSDASRSQGVKTSAEMLLPSSSSSPLPSSSTLNQQDEVSSPTSPLNANNNNNENNNIHPSSHAQPDADTSTTTTSTTTNNNNNTNSVPADAATAVAWGSRGSPSISDNELANALARQIVSSSDPELKSLLQQFLSKVNSSSSPSTAATANAFPAHLPNSFPFQSFMSPNAMPFHPPNSTAPVTHPHAFYHHPPMGSTPVPPTFMPPPTLQQWNNFQSASPLSHHPMGVPPSSSSSHLPSSTSLPFSSAAGVSSFDSFYPYPHAPASHSFAAMRSNNPSGVSAANFNPFLLPSQPRDVIAPSDGSEQQFVENQDHETTTDSTTSNKVQHASCENFSSSKLNSEVHFPSRALSSRLLPSPPADLDTSKASASSNSLLTDDENKTAPFHGVSTVHHDSSNSKEITSTAEAKQEKSQQSTAPIFERIPSLVSATLPTDSEGNYPKQHSSSSSPSNENETILTTPDNRGRGKINLSQSLSFALNNSRVGPVAQSQQQPSFFVRDEERGCADEAPEEESRRVNESLSITSMREDCGPENAGGGGGGEGLLTMMCNSSSSPSAASKTLTALHLLTNRHDSTTSTATFMPSQSQYTHQHGHAMHFPLGVSGAAGAEDGMFLSQNIPLQQQQQQQQRSHLDDDRMSGHDLHSMSTPHNQNHHYFSHHYLTQNSDAMQPHPSFSLYSHHAHRHLTSSSLDPSTLSPEEQTLGVNGAPDCESIQSHLIDPPTTTSAAATYHHHHHLNHHPHAANHLHHHHSFYNTYNHDAPPYPSPHHFHNSMASYNSNHNAPPHNNNNNNNTHIDRIHSYSSNEDTLGGLPQSASAALHHHHHQNHHHLHSQTPNVYLHHSLHSHLSLSPSPHFNGENTSSSTNTQTTNENAMANNTQNNNNNSNKLDASIPPTTHFTLPSQAAAAFRDASNHFGSRSAGGGPLSFSSSSSTHPSRLHLSLNNLHTSNNQSPALLNNLACATQQLVPSTPSSSSCSSSCSSSAAANLFPSSSSLSHQKVHSSSLMSSTLPTALLHAPQPPLSTPTAARHHLHALPLSDTNSFHHATMMTCSLSPLAAAHPPHGNGTNNSNPLLSGQQSQLFPSSSSLLPYSSSNNAGGEAMTSATSDGLSVFQQYPLHGHHQKHTLQSTIMDERKHYYRGGGYYTYHHGGNAETTITDSYSTNHQQQLEFDVQLQFMNDENSGVSHSNSEKNGSQGGVSNPKSAFIARASTTLPHASLTSYAYLSSQQPALGLRMGGPRLPLPSFPSVSCAPPSATANVAANSRGAACLSSPSVSSSSSCSEREKQKQDGEREDAKKSERRKEGEVFEDWDLKVCSMAEDVMKLVDEDEEEVEKEAENNS